MSIDSTFYLPSFIPFAFLPKCNGDLYFVSEKLQKMLILAYEPLDTAEGRDLCYSCVEFPFFKPLWPSLLAVLRLVSDGAEPFPGHACPLVGSLSNHGDDDGNNVTNLHI